VPGLNEGVEVGAVDVAEAAGPEFAAEPESGGGLMEPPGVAGKIDVNNVLGVGDCWLTVQSLVSRSSRSLCATWPAAGPIDLFCDTWFGSGFHVMSGNGTPSTYTLTKAEVWPDIEDT